MPQSAAVREARPSGPSARALACWSAPVRFAVLPSPPVPSRLMCTGGPGGRTGPRDGPATAIASCPRPRKMRPVCGRLAAGWPARWTGFGVSSVSPG